MIPEEFRVRLCQFFRQPNRLPFKRDEVLFQRGMREEFAEAAAQNHVEVFVQRDQPAVKGRIVQSRETKPVTRVQTLGGELAPRLDVARHEQARDIDAADAATDIVGIEHGLPEKLLPAPHLDGCLRLGRPGGGHNLHLAPRQKIQFLVVILREKIV